MSSTSLNISFSETADNGLYPSDCMFLEQKSWGTDVGKTTTLQGLSGIISAVTGSAFPEVACGGINGIFNATIYLYRCATIPYRFSVSHGFIKSRITESIYRDEVIQCSMKITHKLKYPASGSVSLSWPFPCYDIKGNLTSNPTAKYADDIITISKQVYGTIRVRYRVSRVVLTIQISERTTSIENKLQSYAYCVWDGGLAWIPIDPPAGFEAFSGDCGNGAFYSNGTWGLPNSLFGNYLNGSISQGSLEDICHHRYSSLPVATSGDRKIDVDYCNQEITSDNVSGSVERGTVDLGCK